MALGIPNYDQAARISQFTLDKAIGGNTYITFDTSVKALGLRPGDIITVTYLKEGFERQPFRITKDRAGRQLPDHDDYGADLSGRLVRGYERPDTGRHGRDAAAQCRRGRAASAARKYGRFQRESRYQIVESSDNASDGGVNEELTVALWCRRRSRRAGPAYRW